MHMNVIAQHHRHNAMVWLTGWISGYAAHAFGDGPANFQPNAPENRNN